MSEDPPSEADDAPPARPTLKQRLAAHVDEFGRIAIITYFTLSILTIIGFAIAIGIGASPSSATGVIGVIVAGWIAAKATLPLRIVITLAVTPVVALVVKRPRRTRPADPDADAARPPDADAAPPPGSDVEPR